MNFTWPNLLEIYMTFAWTPHNVRMDLAHIQLTLNESYEWMNESFIHRDSWMHAHTLKCNNDCNEIYSGNSLNVCLCETTFRTTDGSDWWQIGTFIKQILRLYFITDSWHLPGVHNAHRVIASIKVIESKNKNNIIFFKVSSALIG